MNSQRIFVAGSKGMVGSAIIRKLEQDQTCEIITASKQELNLTDQASVNAFFKKNRVDQIYLAAAKVGGIGANLQYPADFIYQNLMIQSNVINAAHCNDVQKLLFLGSSCIYPKFSQQPIDETELLTGHLEPTNEPYAIAKIAGIKMCESYNRQYERDYRSVMPTNLYGIHDNFHPKNSHVIPALIRRIHEAKLANLKDVEIWGTGKPLREFLYVDDMAEACVHIQNLELSTYQHHINPMLSHINIGTNDEVSILQLANVIKDVVGYSGQLIFDSTQPDGTLRKLLNSQKINKLGWQPQIGLKQGLKITYDWFLENENQLRQI
ncbi:MULTISPECIES: GDP-L-fucose synthase [Acinetobacter]|uniref:GDP-L-fucose synthase n=1 Tax=Acinetobacter chengduensis TaxID=2420890 RepID=A0ABX9TVA7_9GAMM|nr:MULTISPECIES: GDP-L-fucose synthase [Acinetobacter]MBI1451844.1 GDP-L-fucose synthase [Acinetobacter sp. FL51]RKG44180.1 GDP-L-fucose synthase [Acinetobacter sp. WCHAc060007]RLL21515.1 NAD-dependent epimerase/dehydratase family protein [Acinetobacter chengduensis]